MTTIVIGAGLIGLTSAYALQQQGEHVIVVEREVGPGLGASFANGTLLTPSMSEPWNGPGVWRLLLSSLVRRDSPMQLRVAAVPRLIGWGMRFMRNSTADAFDRSTLRNLRLALYSLERMAELRARTGIEYGRSARGTLRIFRDLAKLDQAIAVARSREQFGLEHRPLSAEETIVLEPALEPISHELSGSVQYLSDETGDAFLFCRNLAAYLEANGVAFRYGARVAGIEPGERVSISVHEGDPILGDRCVAAAGIHSAALLRPLGIRLPLAPAKGYSVSYDGQAGPAGLSIPIVDDALHAVVAPLPSGLRVAGTAEFAGLDSTLRSDRIANLEGLLKTILPKARVDEANRQAWCGFRPMSVDGVPIIGATALENVFVNVGHGHLGWTMAAGSAALLSEIMNGGRSALDRAEFALARFR